MDENRIAGTARNFGGAAQEELGKVTGDAKMQAEGLIDQAQGAARDLYGQARDNASSIEKAIRNKIETLPYTAAACLGPWMKFWEECTGGSDPTSA